jgi:hypothetical protein
MDEAALELVSLRDIPFSPDIIPRVLNIHSCVTWRINNGPWNAVVEWLPLLLRTGKTLGSNLSPETGYPD